jgi:hypothetical protein
MKHFRIAVCIVLYSFPCVAFAQQLKGISLDTLWKALVFEKGGCLTGGQYIYNGKAGHEGCVLASGEYIEFSAFQQLSTAAQNKYLEKPYADTIHGKLEWTTFFSFDSTKLTYFLLQKLADTSTTKIHTCPFSMATSGEVAVYCLQRMYLINWYDFQGFEEYEYRDSEGSKENKQLWLQAILRDDKKRVTLSECWIKELFK